MTLQLLHKIIIGAVEGAVQHAIVVDAARARERRRASRSSAMDATRNPPPPPPPPPAVAASHAVTWTPAHHGVCFVPLPLPPQCSPALVAAQLVLLGPAAVIPAHDHPGMRVTMLCMSGECEVVTLRPLRPPSPLPHAPGDYAWTAVQMRDARAGADLSSALNITPPELGLVHAVAAAAAPTVLLDVLTPPYDPLIRPCWYYDAAPRASAELGDTAAPVAPPSRTLAALGWPESRLVRLRLLQSSPPPHTRLAQPGGCDEVPWSVASQRPPAEHERLM
jgi:hypothetical protein